MTILGKEKLQLSQKVLVKKKQLEKKIALFKVKEKSLFISSLFMLEDLFHDSFLIIQYILSNKIKVTTLVTTFATRFGFIDEEFVEIVYKRFEIQSQCMTKSKPI